MKNPKTYFTLEVQCLPKEVSDFTEQQKKALQETSIRFIGKYIIQNFPGQYVLKIKANK